LENRVFKHPDAWSIWRLLYAWHWFLNSKTAWLGVSGGYDCVFACIYNYCCDQMSFWYNDSYRKEWKKVLFYFCCILVTRSDMKFGFNAFQYQNKIIHYNFVWIRRHLHAVITPSSHHKTFEYSQANSVLKYLSLKVGDLRVLIIYGFTSRSRIFHLYGDVTNGGEGLQH
jgi:hypothetical protein